MDAGTLVLAGHSGAGPLLGAVGARLRVRGRPTGGYLFCDAGLPADGATRLELLAAEDPEMAAAFRVELERAGSPTWGDADLAPLVPDPAAALDAGHFHPLADPGAVADALLGLLARL